MDQARWQQVKAIFDEAVEFGPEDRRALLDHRCGDDPELRGRVEAMLEASEKAGDFLEEPVLGDAVLLRDALADGAVDEVPTFADGIVVAERYRIVRLLARGGMGEVYEAEDGQLGGSVAIKTVRPELARTGPARERFRREMKLARRVTHPGICRIFDLGVHAPESGEPVLFLTMELLAGETLTDRLRHAGRLDEATARPLVQQMVDALQAAHDAGVIHRDFKSSNVMLVPRPEGERVVVTDFGIARSTLLDGAGDASLTATGALIGSPAYMAPEQVEGRAPSAAVDVYALGVVMYEMLTGVLPFHDDTPMSAAVRRLTELPLPPRRHVRGLARTWERVILRCLERAPADRFARVADVTRALGGEAIAAGPRQRRRRRRAVLTVCCGVLLLVGVAWLARRASVDPAADDGELGTGRLVAGNLLIQRLTSTVEREEESSFAPDGKSLVHTVYQSDGQQDLYLARLESRERTRLTATEASEEDPHFAPSGDSIIYTRHEPGDGRPGVWTLSIAGGEPTRIVDLATTPAYSPDGREIAVSRRADDGTFEIVRKAVSPDGRPRRVSRWPYEIRTLAWSPDGMSVAWSDGKQILVADAVGGEPRVIGAFADTRKVAWAPSGEALYCDAYWHGQGNLLRVPLDGGEPVQLTGGNDAFSPAISPDGRRIVYSQEQKQVAAVLVDAGGASPRPIPLPTTIDRVAVDRSGTRIAFTNWVPGPGERSLAIAELGDQSRTQITDGYSPAFARDGRRLAYNDGQRIHIRDLAGGGDRAFDATTGYSFTFQPAFSPDGARMAFPHDGGPGGAGLSILDMALGSVTPLLSGEMGAPAFSPAGTMVAVSATIDGVAGLYLVDVPNGTACWLAASHSYKAAPVWAVDGRSLQVLVDERRHPTLVTVGIDGRELGRLPLQVATDAGFWGVFEAHPVADRGWLLLQERYVGDLYLVEPPRQP